MYTESEKFAVLAEVAYDNKKLDEYFGPGQYELDPELTTKNSAVIIGPESDITISYRGTNLHDISDIVADIGITIGLNHLPAGFRPSRFKEANQTYNNVVAKYPSSKIVTTGHSLGGAQSLQVAKEHQLEGHHYNIGASVVDAGLQLKNFVSCSGENACPELKKQTIYSTGSDILSAGMLPHLTRMFGKEKVEFKKPRLDIRDFFNHSLAHFLPAVRDIAVETKKSVVEIYNKIEESDPIKFAIMSKRDTDFCVVFANHPVCLKTKIKQRREY